MLRITILIMSSLFFGYCSTFNHSNTKEVALFNGNTFDGWEGDTVHTWRIENGALPIEAALTKLKDAHKSQDLAQIDAAMTELNAAWTTASEEMYKATQEAGEQPGGNGEQGGDTTDNAGETVTDAEFEEVK